MAILAQRRASDAAALVLQFWYSLTGGLKGRMTTAELNQHEYHVLAVLFYGAVSNMQHGHPRRATQRVPTA